MPYNFVADSFYTKKNFEADFLQAKYNFRHKMAVFEPPFRGIRSNVRRSSQAYWKMRSGLPISVN